MTRKRHYRLWRLRYWLLILPLFSACHGTRNEKKLNRYMSLGRKDKIPYGCYAAYENLSSLFPNATIELNKRSPVYLNVYGRSKEIYIIIAREVDPDPAELRGIMNFVGQGNTVFISSLRFGDSLLHSLNIKRGERSFNPFFPDSLQLSVYDPLTHLLTPFVYPGDAYDSYAAAIDSQYATVLGMDSRGRPDLIRMTYKGGGALYLHFAPLAFSNFFLLHKENMEYYDKVFSYLPVSATAVRWDDYFRYSQKSFSAFRYIVQNPQNGSLRWAFFLLLWLFLIIYLFESKRRQRMIPVIPVLSNTSLDFVKTIGRLYYQRRDNRNLALKMAAHFQDLLRTRYNLPWSASGEGLIERLSHKTDLSREFLREVITAVRALQEGNEMTDAELLEFSGKLNQFYKQV